MHLRNLSAPIIFLIGVAMPGIAATPPGPMMANVYRLTEAAAVLTVCFESPLYTKLSNDKALQLHGLVIRLADLVQNIAKHYKDDALYLTFEATRVKISSEVEMKNYVKSKYEYCGDQLFRDMEAYVSENEKLINGYLNRQSRGR